MPYDPVTGQGTGFGGLLGSALSNPLFQFGMGLLATNKGPTTTQKSPFGDIGTALAYTSEAQKQQIENQLYREKILQARREQAGQEAFGNLIGTEGFPLPKGMSPE